MGLVCPPGHPGDPQVPLPSLGRPALRHRLEPHPPMTCLKFEFQIILLGNDLARALKWGGGYSGEKVMQLLLSIEDADIVQLDRCVCVYISLNFALNSCGCTDSLSCSRWNISWKEEPSLLPSNQSSATPILTTPQSVIMNNYCGIGLDAAIALEFHLAREENPEKFNSRLEKTCVH